MHSVHQLIRYGLVGVANTLVTLAVIAMCAYAGAGPVVANILGLCVGLLNSFLMNRRFTFKENTGASRLGIFLISFGVAYAVNLAVLLWAHPLESIHLLAPQIAGMFAYNVTFFPLMKFWVFSRPPRSAE